MRGQWSSKFRIILEFTFYASDSEPRVQRTRAEGLLASLKYERPKADIPELKVLLGLKPQQNLK